MRLIAEALTSTRGGRSLFSDLSFSVEGGEALVLMGPNGAGKTTSDPHRRGSACSVGGGGAA